MSRDRDASSNNRLAKTVMGNSLHIAVGIPALGGGGAERSVLKLARGLIGRGHVVDILVFSESNVLASEVPDGARIFAMDCNRYNRISDRATLLRRFGLRIFKYLRRQLLRDARSVAAYIDQERPDCIIPSLLVPKYATLLARSFSRFKPVVIPILHSVPMNRSQKTRKLYSIILPTADQIVGVSNGVVDEFVSELRIPRERMSAVYNPVYSKEIAELAAATPEHPWLSDGDRPIILSAGRLTEIKDFATLLRAFHQVLQARDVRLIVLGEGSLRQQLEDFALRLRINANVSFPGWVANPYAFMSRASVFVLSSKGEGLPTVLIEALACGCPCVSTNCPSGPREILDDGRIGSLVPVGNASALALAIERTLDSRVDRAMLMARAADFSVDASVDSYERIVQDLVDKQRRNHERTAVHHRELRS